MKLIKKSFVYYFDKITSILPKSKPLYIKNPKKILILRNDHIGDLVVTTAIFREIKKKFPKSEITAVVSPIAKSVIEKNKNVDKIIEMNLFWRDKNIKSFLRYLRVLKKIRKEKFDVGIDFRGSLLNTFFFLFLGKVKKRVAYISKESGRIFLTNPIFFVEGEHGTKEKIRLVNEGLGMNSKNYWPEIITDSKDEKEVKKFLKENKINKFIGIIPGTTSETKAWPLEKYNEFIKKFNKKYSNYKILLFGGKSDEPKIDYLKNNNKNCLSIINFNLRLASILFKKAKVMIACDGGAKEIVWVVKGNLIDLEGPLDSKFNYSSGKNVKILRHKPPCYPCDWSKPCKKPYGVWCMELISVNEVMKATNDFLKKDTL